jgi:YVTN family beta-propeller protein
MLALSADERRLYVANSGSGSVTALQVGGQGERQGATTIKVGGVPMGLALSPDEKSLYVATRDGNQVAVIDTATGGCGRRCRCRGSRRGCASPRRAPTWWRP